MRRKLIPLYGRTHRMLGPELFALSLGRCEGDPNPGGVFARFHAPMVTEVLLCEFSCTQGLWRVINQRKLAWLRRCRMVVVQGKTTRVAITRETYRSELNLDQDFVERLGTAPACHTLRPIQRGGLGLLNSCRFSCYPNIRRFQTESLTRLLTCTSSGPHLWRVFP